MAPVSKTAPPDRFGKPVGNGEFAFYTATDRFVRIRPCHGDTQVLDAALTRLKERTTNRLDQLLVNLDCDAPSGDRAAVAEQLRSRLRAVEDRVHRAGGVVVVRAPGEFALDGGNTTISAVIWHSNEPGGIDLPGTETLERLICASLQRVHPERAAAVAQWLADRPKPPAPSGKEHAWSHMAGWYADQGCDDFHQALWRDPAVAAEIERRLTEMGVWQSIARFGA